MRVLPTDVPSEAYWKKLAQSKSKALDDTLEVNRILSEKLKELEELMEIKDQMLDEARAMNDVIRVNNVNFIAFWKMYSYT